MKKAFDRGRSKLIIPGLLLLPAAIMLNWVAGFFPAFIEKAYASGLNPFIVRPLSLATGWFPFSIGEFTGLLLLMGLIWYGAVKLYRYKKGNEMRPSLRTILTKFLAILGFVYALFILLWGLNYHRLSFAEMAGLTISPADSQELDQVCQELLERASLLRSTLPQDVNGVMYLQYGKKQVLLQAQDGYDAAARFYPQLGGSYGRPKGIFFSEYMSYLGISGVYNPLTGEANVNLAFPDALMPAAVCHEMAHQHGFAREDEANYIAYLTCNYNPDREFQYSGTLLALLHAMAVLKVSSPSQYNDLEKKISPEIRVDLNDYYAYWRRHEGLAAKFTTRMNDIYLKSNRQSDGIMSYNRMVELLLAEYRSGRKLPAVNY